MTLGDWLLVCLIIATLMGAGLVASVSLHSHKSQANWRRQDRLRDFIASWRTQVEVPDFGWTLSWKGKEFHLTAENDGFFALALNLCPEKPWQQYEKFKEATSNYIKYCCYLFDDIAKDCEEKTGFPLGEGHEKDWPENVITPVFIGTVSKFVKMRDQSHLMDKDISYDINSFHRTGGAGDWARKGLELRLTCAILEFQNTPIVQVRESEEALLKQLEIIHRQMMSAEYKKKFEKKVNEIYSLKDKAEGQAEEVRSVLRQLETS